MFIVYKITIHIIVYNTFYSLYIKLCLYKKPCSGDIQKEVIVTNLFLHSLFHKKHRVELLHGAAYPCERSFSS